MFVARRLTVAVKMTDCPPGRGTAVSPALVEGLYAADFDHLQRLYERINSDGEAVGVLNCPACAHQFEVDLSEIEGFDLGIWRVRCPREPADVLEYQPIPRGGE